MAEKTVYNECYSCKNGREILGNAHIRCDNPDPEMTGSEYGIKNGWFFYPFVFGPIWKTKMCANFTPTIYSTEDIHYINEGCTVTKKSVIKKLC